MFSIIQVQSREEFSRLSHAKLVKCSWDDIEQTIASALSAQTEQEAIWNSDDWKALTSLNNPLMLKSELHELITFGYPPDNQFINELVDIVFLCSEEQTVIRKNIKSRSIYPLSLWRKSIKKEQNKTKKAIKRIAQMRKKYNV